MKSVKTMITCICFITILIASEKIAVATKVIGEVHYIRGDGSQTPLKNGHIFETGDVLKTEKNGFAALIFIDDKTALKVKENSELTISGKRSIRSISKEISLKGGSLRAQVSRQKKGEFIIRTSVSVASVKGTDFWLISNKTGDSLIGLEGVVAFSNILSGDALDITRGKTGISTPDGNVQSFKTDPKTIPDDPSDNATGSQKLEIEFQDAFGKKKTLIIEYK